MADINFNINFKPLIFVSKHSKTCESLVSSSRIFRKINPIKTLFISGYTYNYPGGTFVRNKNQQLTISQPW